MSSILARWELVDHAGEKLQTWTCTADEVVQVASAWIHEELDPERGLVEMELWSPSYDQGVLMGTFRRIPYTDRYGWTREGS